jgi:hypothetical protein
MNIKKIMLSLVISNFAIYSQAKMSICVGAIFGYARKTKSNMQNALTGFNTPSIGGGASSVAGGPPNGVFLHTDTFQPFPFPFPCFMPAEALSFTQNGYTAPGKIVGLYNTIAIGGVRKFLLVPAVGLAGATFQSKADSSKNGFFSAIFGEANFEIECKKRMFGGTFGAIYMSGKPKASGLEGGSGIATVAGAPCRSS